jgi:hypothetical protein
MILDATAGNRVIWTYKKSENIIYADIEKQLWVKPTIIADNRQLPFQDKTFHTIFFDPPHDWGDEPFDFKIAKWDKSRRLVRNYAYGYTYYGWDKYKTKKELIKYIYNAQIELHRVLKDDGLLFVKWCEMRMSRKSLLALLDRWRLLMEIAVGDPLHTLGKSQTWWLIMEKKEKENRELSEYAEAARCTQDYTSSQASEAWTPSATARQAQLQSDLQRFLAPSSPQSSFSAHQSSSPAL